MEIFHEADYGRAARRFHETYSKGRLLNKWCDHRAQTAILLSDLAVAAHAARHRRLVAGWRQLCEMRPHRLASARRRHAQLARCAAEILQLRQIWLRQSHGIALRRWAEIAGLSARLQTTARVLSDAIRAHALEDGLVAWAKMAWLQGRAVAYRDMLNQRDLQTSIRLWAQSARAWVTSTRLRREAAAVSHACSIQQLAAAFAALEGYSLNRSSWRSLQAFGLRRVALTFGEWLRKSRRRWRTLVICNTVVLREMSTAFAVWICAAVGCRTAKTSAHRAVAHSRSSEQLHALLRLVTHARRFGAVAQLRRRTATTARRREQALVLIAINNWIEFVDVTERLQAARVRGFVKSLERALLLWRRRFAGIRWKRASVARGRWRRYGQKLRRSAITLRCLTFKNSQRRSRIRKLATERSWRVAYDEFASEAQRIDGFEISTAGRESVDTGYAGGGGNGREDHHAMRHSLSPSAAWTPCATACGAVGGSPLETCPTAKVLPCKRDTFWRLSSPPPDVLEGGLAARGAFPSVHPPARELDSAHRALWTATPQSVREWREGVGCALRVLPAIFDPGGQLIPGQSSIAGCRYLSQREGLRAFGAETQYL